MSGRHTAERFTPLSFSRTDQQEFAKELKQAVNEYFKSNSLKHSGGVKFFLKAPIIAAFFFVPFTLIMTGVITNPWLLVLSAIVMGIGTACIGLVIMHDANHGAASSKPWVNKWLGYSLNFLGGHAVNWRIQHNVLHHTFTNIHGYDEDIVSTFMLRFSPTVKWRWFHRYQHIYALFFYSILTMHWSGYGDFGQLYRYKKMGLLASQKANYAWEMTKLCLSKVGYYLFLMGLPLLLTDLSVWQVVLGYVLMHVVAGSILSLVFQAAHIFEFSEFVEKPDERTIEKNFMVHQLETTRNFATKSKWFTWMVGGLNHQVEHHLFPNISHVHYPAIAGIVEKTAKKYEVAYHKSTTFWDALCIHFRFLKLLGQPATA